MALGLSQAELAIIVRAQDEFSRTFSKASGAMSGLANQAQKLRLPIILATGAMAALGVASVKAAGDQVEAINKANVTFKQHADQIQEFADTSAETFGISTTAANEYTAVLGNIFQASGLATGASADMSIAVTKLAADMASFNNIPIDVALEKLRSGLVGEAEPLRTLGVLISDAAVKAQAYKDGIAELDAELTEGQKVQARYNLILAQTANAQGDFARTSDDMANAQRIIGARIDDLKADIGQKLLPLWSEVLTVVADKVIPALENKLPGAIDAAVEAFNDARPIMEVFFDTVRIGAEWIVNNKVAIVAALTAIGVAMLLAFPEVAIAAAVVAIITSIGLLTQELDKMSESALKARKRILELGLRLAEAGNDVLGFLGPVGVAAKAALELADAFGANLDPADRLRDQIAEVDAALDSLAANRAAEDAIDDLGDQARISAAQLENLRGVVLGLMRAEGALAAQRAAFLAGPTEDPFETFRRLEREFGARMPTAPIPSALAPDLSPDGVGAEVIKGAQETIEALMPIWLKGALQWMEAVQEALDNEQAWKIIESTIESRIVRLQDVLRLLDLGAFGQEVAQDFIAALRGESSDIGAAIFDAAAAEAREAAQEAAVAFREEFEAQLTNLGDIIADQLGVIRGIAGGESVESAEAALAIAERRLRLIGLELAAQRQVEARLRKIAELEQDIVDIRQDAQRILDAITDRIEREQDALAEAERRLADEREAAAERMAVAEEHLRDVREAGTERIRDMERELSNLRNQLDRSAAIAGGERTLTDISEQLEQARQAGNIARARGFAAELAAATAAAQARVGELEEEISAEEALIQAAQDAVDAIQDTVGAIEEEIAGRKALIEALKEDLDLVTEARDDEIAAVEDQIEAIRNQTSAYEDAVAAINDEIEAIERAQRARQLERDIAVLQAQLALDSLPTEEELLANLAEQVALWAALNDVFDNLSQGIFDVADAALLMQAGLADLAALILQINAGLLPAPGGAGIGGAGAGLPQLGAGLPAQTIYVDTIIIQGDPAETLAALGA